MVTALGALMLVLPITVLTGGVSSGIQGGTSSSDLAKSVVRITYTGPINGKYVTGAMGCTGSVVGDGWVLTAYHCLTLVNNDWPGLQVELWQNGTVNAGPVWRSRMATAPLIRAGSSTSGTLYSDVMLIQTSTAMPPWAKTIPMALAWPALGTKLTEYGYGGMTFKKGSEATTLQKTPDGDLARVDCGQVASGYAWTSGHICTLGKVSTAWKGDSGGPLLWWVNGYWQQVGDFSAFPNTTGIHWQSYWSEADAATRGWITSIVTGPVAQGTILRDAASGAAWRYGADGYRRWIPDATTYNCLVSAGVPVLNWTLRHVETVPDMVGSRATCTAPPPPTALYNEVAWGPPGSTVPLFSGGPGVNSNGATGPAATIPVGTVIQTNCRSYNLAIAPSNTGGWWYRIAAGGYTGYWTPASVYENGTGAWPAGDALWDPAVPVC